MAFIINNFKNLRLGWLRYWDGVYKKLSGYTLHHMFLGKIRLHKTG